MSRTSNEENDKGTYISHRNDEFRPYGVHRHFSSPLLDIFHYSKNYYLVRSILIYSQEVKELILNPFTWKRDERFVDVLKTRNFADHLF